MLLPGCPGRAVMNSVAVAILPVDDPMIARSSVITEFSSARTSFVPSTMAFSFANARSRGMNFMPQSGLIYIFSPG